MLGPVNFNRFRGLLLDRPIDEVGPEDAIELLDVDWDASTGTIRSREGVTKSTVEGAAAYGPLFAHNESIFLSRRTTNLVAMTTSEEKKTSASFGETKNSFTHFGTPSAEYSYIANGENTLRRFDGTNFSEPKATVDGETEKAMPKGNFLANWADGGNRLVVAGTASSGGPNGATSSSSHVWFSEPGNAEAYESTAYVQLLPGDGEKIRACCIWGGMVFVFKETNLFVFYGVSTDEEGKPEFNFRSVPLGGRLSAPGLTSTENKTSSLQPAAPGRDGVYFVTNDGIYLTTGGSPALISGKVEALRYTALWTPSASELCSARWSRATGLFFAGERLYIPCAEFSGMIVYNSTLDEWTAWNISSNLTSLAERPSSSRPVFFVANKNLYQFSRTVSTDAATTLNPIWQSGFYDLGSPDEKTLTAMKLWGTGAVSVKVAREFGSLGSATSFSLGTGILSEGMTAVQKNKSQTGAFFSHRIEGTAPWFVQRLTRWQRENRVPTTKTR